MKVKLYSGSSHPQLAEDLSRVSQIPLGKVSLSRFDNRESRVMIEDRPPQTAIVLQSLSVPVDHHLFEMLLMVDALKRLGTRQIILVIPWLGYSKQDKVFRPGEPLSVKVVANCIQTLPVSQLITLDLHNPAISGFFDIPIHNCSAQSLVLDYARTHQLTDTLMLVSPDAGAIKNSTQIADKLGVPVAYLNKTRDLKTGEVKITEVSRSVQGHDILIADDMIVTGSTLISATAFLKAHGAGSVTVSATHHLQLKGVQTQLDNSGIDKIIFTDSILPAQPLSPKAVILSCAGLLAQTLDPMIN